MRLDQHLDQECFRAQNHYQATATLSRPPRSAMRSRLQTHGSLGSRRSRVIACAATFLAALPPDAVLARIASTWRPTTMAGAACRLRTWVSVRSWRATVTGWLSGATVRSAAETNDYSHPVGIEAYSLGQPCCAVRSVGRSAHPVVSRKKCE